MGQGRGHWEGRGWCRGERGTTSMGKIDTALQEAYVLQHWHGEWVAMHVGELGQALPSLLLFIPSLLPASLPFCLSSILPSISLSPPFHTSSFYTYLHVYLPFSPLLVSPSLFSSPPGSLCMCTYARVCDSIRCPHPRRMRCSPGWACCRRCTTTTGPTSPAAPSPSRPHH